MTVAEQLALWVKGESVHNPTRDECCPDFSCCQPELLADLETRRAFAAGGPTMRNHLLGGFLNKLIALRLPQKKVYIAGAKR